MASEKMRRFVFVLAAVALFLATVMPGMSVSASMGGSAPKMTMAAMEGMDCPDCDASRDNIVGCVQATCIGLAVMANAEYFNVPATRPAYAITAVAWPDEFKSAPSTPPI